MLFVRLWLWGSFLALEIGSLQFKVELRCLTVVFGSVFTYIGAFVLTIDGVLLTREAFCLHWGYMYLST